MNKEKIEPATMDFSEEIHEGARDVAVHSGTGTAIARSEQAAFSATSMMAMVRELALDERIDAGKLETVMRVANQQQDREREIQFYQDKNRAVREMPLIRKDGRIVIYDKNYPDDLSKARVQGHFEKWADVQAAVTPILDRHNLTLTHKIDHADGQTVVIAVLGHDNGYREESGPMKLPLDTSGGKNNVQGAGSSQTYGMRYTTRAICGLKLVGGQQDDDGNLTAMPDEPLNDQQARRVEEAERAFERGQEAYNKWFQGIPTIDRAWMIQSGRHFNFGGKALPGAQTSERAPDAKRQSDKPNPADAAREWAEEYIGHCHAAESLEALTKLQAHSADRLARLQKNFPDLHELCVDAGRTAYNHLSGGDE